MKSSILTFSQTGNTLKAGNSIAKGLERAGFKVDQLSFMRRNRWKPDNVDLIGIGSPVFENRPAEVVTEYLQKNRFDFAGKKAFVFITSGGSPAKSLWHLSKAVAGTGAMVLGGIQLRGVSSFPTLFGLFPGRPNKEDLEEAENFGCAIGGEMINGEPVPLHYRIASTHGGIFYDNVGPILNYIKKKTTPLPVSNPDKCDLCGNCVYECPTESITVENKLVKFHDTCIVCYRCWGICPRNAISIKFSPGGGLIERLIYGERMERIFGDIKPGEYVGKNLYKDVLARKIRLKYDRKNPTSEYEYKES